MVRGVGTHHGGIGRLRRLLDEYEGPITAELLKVGLHVRDLGTEKLDWREFKFFLENLPPLPSNALFRAMRPESWHWDTTSDLLAAIAFATQGANWQRAGGDESSKPTPVTRPLEAWERPDAEEDDGSYTPDTIRDELARRRASLANQ